MAGFVTPLMLSRMIFLSSFHVSMQRLSVSPSILLLFICISWSPQQKFGYVPMPFHRVAFPKALPAFRAPPVRVPWFEDAVRAWRWTPRHSIWSLKTVKGKRVAEWSHSVLEMIMYWHNFSCQKKEATFRDEEQTRVEIFRASVALWRWGLWLSSSGAKYIICNCNPTLHGFKRGWGKAALDIEFRTYMFRIFIFSILVRVMCHEKLTRQSLEVNYKYHIRVYIV